jgi:hypothetical protein
LSIWQSSHSYTTIPDKSCGQSTRLSLQSSELAPPAPSPAGECVPRPHWFQGEKAHSLAGEGVGRANSDEATDILGTLDIVGIV